LALVIRDSRIIHVNGYPFRRNAKATARLTDADYRIRLLLFYRFKETLSRITKNGRNLNRHNLSTLNFLR